MRATMWLVCLGVVCLAVAASPAIAAAQGSEARIRIAASGGIQTSGNAVSQSFTVTTNLEPGTVTAEIPLDQAPFFDVGGWARLFGRFGAGVSFSRITRTADATVTASIPHPFYFNQPRQISGTQPGAAEEENAVHIDFVALVAATDRLELTVFVGPTVFNSRQDLVTDVSYTESYPFDTATFTSATLTQQSLSKTGVNVGADITWTLTPHVGVGGLFRFSHASATYTAAPNNEATATLGGLQAGAGIRVRF
jgi:opacity protein-like surface antigen